MNTRQTQLKKAKDLQVGDLVDFGYRVYGHGIKYRIVDSEPSHRVSEPSQVAFLCHVYDPDDKSPPSHEGRQSCSVFLSAEKDVRVKVK